ncbi:elongation factor P maturation arginine rhamnosyltransferase EarP [Pseudogulbenkiania sp. MAI-1]|uniref:elongation factor P maturation arginine rhamnosyltransferase EarP n=1 Tax=Pseudogulbenkiania sp. MAI-1 TaxID=990370 RepID=UPI00045EC20A|nr:elongation factor P maturation arginine rhamnosyltransferase EarP [Pseudogulbenkiania sp. MAI-1]
MPYRFSARHWDIFCTVIDNYGDIGVTWRLARQLRHEFGQTVRLWVDDLASFARLCPDLDPDLDEQERHGVTLRRWPTAFPDGIAAADVVIEAFGCQLPDSYLANMAARPVKPVWLNLEYLSAEDWVEGCHGLPSPHPRLPLTKYFFFPGFTERTGGLICEAGLLAERTRWQADAAAQAAYWQQLGVPPRAEGELRISLFSYATPAAGELLQAWAAGNRPVRVLVPVGKVLGDVAAIFGEETLQAGEVRQQGSLTVHVLPFTDQPGYDRLLWSCDLNIVRGEDSFVRAQWAARPLLWHIYFQDEDAHLVKLDAFLSHYGATLSDGACTALVATHHAWNRGQGMAEAWAALAPHLDELQGHAHGWPERALGPSDLATRLVQMVENTLQ